MLGAGMLLRNIPWNAITAFPASWGTQMRAGALATIFLRCGCELDLGTMRRYKYPAIRLALLPGLVEAFYDGGLGVGKREGVGGWVGGWVGGVCALLAPAPPRPPPPYPAPPTPSPPAVYNMPVLLAFTMGFILKAVGPGLVVPAMFGLQKAGLGKDQGEGGGCGGAPSSGCSARAAHAPTRCPPSPLPRNLPPPPPPSRSGIPSTVVIAASFDDIIAITGYSIFSALAITGNGNIAWQIASGPAQVVFGVLGGFLGGFALGCTRLFNTRLKRLVGTYGGALLLMYFLEHFDLLR